MRLPEVSRLQMVSSFTHPRDPDLLTSSNSCLKVGIRKVPEVRGHSTTLTLSSNSLYDAHYHQRQMREEDTHLEPKQRGHMGIAFPRFDLLSCSVRHGSDADGVLATICRCNASLPPRPAHGTGDFGAPEPLSFGLAMIGQVGIPYDYSGVWTDDLCQSTDIPSFELDSALLSRPLQLETWFACLPRHSKASHTSAHVLFLSIRMLLRSPSCLGR
ncbi:uncharacterized protein BDZ83DRAFT_653135 [Colletotrichum acutatum]|uniref:Uncharacterized protein n=1 Tax=Glomerella acutata TaxID=27357 RepID=A0AAD8UIC9_GLOAC|nr:uncharacterized protein BDZ83DRAFT_653135 [Colletotrichum acutatum]KAK1723352.1 hypothetical protein BDZ83DRAFT_653135 [Colletotrichum acutatum]